MSKKRVLGLIGAGAIASILGPTLLFPGAAHAAEPNVSIISRADAFWASHGVKAAVRAELEKSVRAGKLPDAVTDTGTPTLSTTRQGDYVVTVATYPDGSISVSKIQEPLAKLSAGRVRPATIKGCSTGGTSGHITYSNCSVSVDNTWALIGFQTSFTYVQGGYDLIENKGFNSYQTCAPGTCTDPKFSSWKQYETSTSRANLTYKSTYHDPASVLTVTYFATLYVGNNAASTSMTTG